MSTYQISRRVLRPTLMAVYEVEADSAEQALALHAEVEPVFVIVAHDGLDEPHLSSHDPERLLRPSKESR